MTLWDGTDLVGSTALLTAAGRAMETLKEHSLAQDPYAVVLTAVSGRSWPQLEDPEFGSHFINFQGARTCFFDTALLQALFDGTVQVVVLAAGLDSRAYRFAGHSEVTYYEIDRAAVLGWKYDTLERLGFTAPGGLVAVEADLTGNWARELLDAGFDIALPTLWIAEGLLLYLPAPARAALFADVHALSAPGSVFTANDSTPLDPAEFHARRLAEMASETSSPHYTLISNDDFPATRWFTEAGWTVGSIPVGEYLLAHGRPTPGPSIARDVFVTATKRSAP